MAQTPANQSKLRRMRSFRRRMSWETFQRLPRQIGWRYEYYDGVAYVYLKSPFVTFHLDLAPRLAPQRRGIRPIRPADAAALLAVFIESFALAPEYANYPTGKFKRRAADYIKGFFGTVRGVASPASTIAVAGGRVIGAALVKQRKEGPLLDCLFVHPDHCRRGWATALAARLVNGLLAAGEPHLTSFALLANGPSLAWHQRFGFREVPDYFVAATRWRYHADELERMRKWAGAPADEVTRMTHLERAWQAEVRRLWELEMSGETNSPSTPA